MQNRKEHRWGERVPLSLAVKIDTPGLFTAGRLVDASVSGARILSELFPPVSTNLRVTVGSEERIELAACVVRHTHSPNGFAFEWRDMGSPSILALLAHAARGKTELWRRDPCLPTSAAPEAVDRLIQVRADVP